MPEKTIFTKKYKIFSKNRLSASLTIEATYIFPIVCIIFASIVSICFYLHDSITMSSTSYLTIIDYSYKVNYDTDFNELDKDDISKKILESINSAIDKYTLKNNHHKIKVNIEDNKFIYSLSSTTITLNKEYDFYSYNNNLRFFKAISDYIQH